MQLYWGFGFPVVSGCEVEFNGFVTAAPNLFIRQQNAQTYANSFSPARPLVQKSYTCPNDVTIQYSYWEVIQGATNCAEFADEFIDYIDPPFFPVPIRFRTYAEAFATIGQYDSTAQVRQFSIPCPFDESIQITYYQVIEVGGDY